MELDDVEAPPPKREDIDRKASTVNTMFVGSTIARPNVDSIIQAVATILHSQMLEDQSQQT